MALFELNKRDPEAAKLLYEQIPNFYTWNEKDNEFHRRLKPGIAVRRINYVPAKIDDAYHLRILINNKKDQSVLLISKPSRVLFMKVVCYNAYFRKLEFPSHYMGTHLEDPV